MEKAKPGFKTNELHLYPFGGKILIGRLTKDVATGSYKLSGVADVITLNVPVQQKNARGEVEQGIQTRYYMVPLGSIILPKNPELCHIDEKSPLTGFYATDVSGIDVVSAA